MTRITALLGTLFYLVWGALHIQAGIAVARLGTGIHHSTATQGRIYQDSWTLFFAAGIHYRARLRAAVARPAGACGLEHRNPLLDLVLHPEEA